MRGLRVGGFAALLLIVAWLAYDSQPAARVGRAVRAGRVGGLDTQEQQALHQALSWVVAGAGLPGNGVAINELRPDAAIRVLTVTDAGSREFNCGPGNAVYDSHLNAILIHVDLARGWLTSEFGTAEMFSIRKTFLLFLLLHEIGHQVLHGATQATYPAALEGGAERARETEADEYAFTRMESLARVPLVASGDASDALAKAWSMRPGSYVLFGFDLVTDLPDPATVHGNYPPPTEEALAQAASLRALPEPVRRDLFILSWMHALPRAAMRADTPYSSFNENEGHATLVRRITDLFNRYRERTAGLDYVGDPDGLWASRTEALAAVQQQLTLLGTISTQPLYEVTLPAAISSMSWEPTRLLIMTDDGNVYTIPRETLKRTGGSSLTRLLLGQDQAIVRPERKDAWVTLQANVWSDEQQRIFTYTDDGMMEARDGFWRRVSEEPLRSLSVLTLTQSRPTLSRWVIWTGDVLKISDPGGEQVARESELVVMDGHKITARRPIAGLFADVEQAAPDRLVTLDLASVTDTAIWLSLWTADDDHLLGFADVDPANLRVRRFVTATHARPIVKDQSFVTVRPGDPFLAVVVTAPGDGTVQPRAGFHVDPVEVATIDGAGTLRRVATVSAPYSRIVAPLPDLSESIVADAQFIDDDHVLLNSHSWSPSFVVDLRDGVSRPLFFPSTSLSATSHDKWVAFVPLSGGEPSLALDPGGNHRCYVMRMGE